MRGKSRKLLATLLTIFMLITNSSEVLAATNISGNIDKAASQMSSLASLIDSKLSKIESPQQKKARELEDAIDKKKQELSKITQVITAPEIQTFKTVTKSMVQIGWTSVGQDAEYELDINGTTIKLGKATSYLDTKAKENKKYDYKVRSVVNGKTGEWSEVKEYNKETSKEDSKSTTSINDASKALSIAPKMLYATSAVTATATDTPITLNMLTHGSTTGDRWLEGCTDGMYGPLEGKIDAIKLSLNNAPTDMKIKYQVYIKENRAWQDWKYNGDQAGELGKTITAVKFKIDGSTYGYSIKYFGLSAGSNPIVYPDTYNGDTSGSEAIDAVGLSGIYMELYKSTVVIDKDTTWSPSDGVRTIDGFVEINENVTLNIAPGTDIRFLNKTNLQSGFIVRGKINAIGTDTSRIKISAIDDNTDLTIKLTSKGVFQGSNLDIAARVTGYYGLFDSSGTISISSSKLTNKINQATGILQVNNSSNLTVDKCDISGFAEGIIYSGIGTCKITNNNINGNGNGVRATTATSISSTNLTDISNNTFTGNNVGVYISGVNNLISRKVSVYNNIIKSSKAVGILIEPGALSNIDIQKNQISATNISKTAGLVTGPIVLHGTISESKEDILATINSSDPAKANTLSGNNYDGIVLAGVIIDSDCTIQKGKNNIIINSELIINANRTLRIKQGVVINAIGTKQSSDSGLTQWVVINGYYPTILVNGQLFCSGTSTEPVVITSVNDKGYGLTYIDNGDVKDTAASAIYVAAQGSFTSDNSIYKNSVIDGLYNNGQVVLNNSTFNNSRYTGIISYGKLNLNKSTISNVTNPSSTDSFAGIGVLDFGEANLVNCNISNITHGSKTAVGALVGGDVGNLYINGGKISNCDNAVYVQNGSATLTNTQISGGKTGLTVSGGKANIVKNLFENCSLNAIDYINGTDYTIRYNSFTNSSTTANALSNRASKTLNAQYNYWGSPYGPNQDTKYSSQKGLYVNGSVDYSNYLSQPIPLDTVTGGDYNNQIVNFITQLDYATQRHFGEEGVNLAAGNYSKTAKDMLISTPGMDIDVYRTYNSKAKDKPSIIGNGWRFSYESSIKDIDASAKITGKTITLPNGSVQSFELKSDGTYSALDSRNKLVFTNNQYILTSRTNDKYIFTNNLLTEMRDKNDNKLSISYDASNNISTISDESGRSYVLSYTNGKLSTITEKIAGVVKRSITYNYSNNLLQSVTDMNGHITETYSYDTQSRLKQVVKDSQVVEEVTYFDDGDNKDKIKTYKNADGNLDTYEYNNTNRSVKTTDSNGAIREQYYDSSMFNILNVNPDGTIETTKYKLDDNNINKYGDIVENKDSLGNTRYFELDSLGNITKQTNPDGGCKVSTYDANNNITKQVDESDKATYYVYDANGNMTKKVMPLNGKDVYSGTDDTNFAIEKYEYYTKQEMQAIGCNIGGLLKTKTDANGGITKYTYDKSGNPSTITDEEGNVTQFTYNEFGFKTVELSPNQFKTT
ncbi:hypothetical protein JHL18_18820 [Clostridium sp. YIM B02505]|uniref:DUF6531 domain-containing protein n=1 Tax=Clostridium yunnanense TaxID=2800325 RepID=A0ABS1ETG3_9CLOT|nr:DUF6531 domain-containing protein [Clostridium yunnanense]MBK1812677.1 hypothetical protein [Clostridium yunnanense]